MTSYEDLHTALEDAIIHCAKEAQEYNGQTAEFYASAARQLAEAKAWLASPSQPHGGNGSTTVGG